MRRKATCPKRKTRVVPSKTKEKENAALHMVLLEPVLQAVFRDGFYVEKINKICSRLQPGAFSIHFYVNNYSKCKEFYSTRYLIFDFPNL